jgi:hypothetical protein
MLCKQGSMSAPFYNSRSTKIAYVLDGEGHIEIVCPHLAQGGESEQDRRGGRSERGRGRRGEEESESESEQEQEQEEAGQGYHTIRARVSRGTAFVVPVGHPVVEVASRGSNLQIVCFEIRADKNEKVFLAGANNVLKKLDSAAKELAFAARSARDVDEVLDAQRDQGFLAGPEESGHQEREQEEERQGRRGRKEREQEEEREGRRGREEREEEEGRRGRGRREELAETFLRLATGRL